MKEKLLLSFLLLACSYMGFAQHTCDLILTPEGNNLCILEKRAMDFSMIRACRGNTVRYRAHSSSAIGYEWTVSGGTYLLNSDSTICEVTWGDGGYGMVIVQALMSDSTICSSQIQVVLEDKPIAGVISQPNYIVDVNNPNQKWIEVCAGDTLSFVDNSMSGELPIVDYYWEFPYGVSNNRAISFVARDPGDYPIIHRVYNECGCYDEVHIKLIVRDECPLKLSCFGTACSYSQHNYSVLSPNCSDYLWNVEGGTIVSPQHRPDITVQWDAPESGFGTIYLDGASCDCNCKSRKSIKIPVISDNVNIKGQDTLCLDEQYTFSVPLWGSTQYSWNVSPSVGIAMTEDNNTMTLIPYQKRTYTISVTYSCDFLGCGPYTVTKVIEVKGKLDVQASPSAQEVCIGSNLTFSASTSAACHWTVELNDSVVHSASASSIAYTFDTTGVFVIRARNANFCNEARMTVTVKGNPPAPTSISGPDTICPTFTAEYSATPSSPDYYILWEWSQDGDTHTYAGNKANITFGTTVEDINVYQVDRRTGCQSEATVFHVSPFRLADWPYHDPIRVCQGQSITLTDLRDQSDNDVLYEWKAVPAYPLSILESHLNAEVKLLANYTSSLPAMVMLILERTYCHTSRYDTAYVRVGEIDPPAIIHDPICMGQWVSFSVSSPYDADKDSSYWYIDDLQDRPVYGIPADLAFGDTAPHVVHLHYVSKYGCEADAFDTVTPCPPLPNMRVVADSLAGTLSIDIDGGGAGYSYRWMTGDTSSSILHSPDDYWCAVTSPDCGCSRELFHYHEGGGCLQADAAFRIFNHCDNIISLGHLSGLGLDYPMEVRLEQNNLNYYYTIDSADQRILVPDTGAYSITVYWHVGDTCYYSIVNDTITTAVNIQLQNDCSGHLLVSAQRTDGARVSIVARASNLYNNTNVAMRMGINSVSITMPDTGWYRVHLQLGTLDCYIDTLFHFDAPPTIQGVDVRRIMCRNTPFRYTATASGEGLTYEWNFGDGSWNYGNGIDHVYGDQNNPIVTLTVSDRNGCTCSSPALVNLSENFLYSYSMDIEYSPICPDDSLVIHTDYNGNNIYAWSPCNRFTSNQAYVYKAGTYIVDITSVREQCRKQLELNVAYPNGPFASILCDSTYCLGEMAELIGDVGDVYTYQWYVRSAHMNDSSASANFDFHISDTGAHQVVLWVTDPNGCTASDTAYFYVHPVPPAPALQFCTNPCITEGPVELCSTTGQSLLWSNGTSGTSALYFTDGPAGAYYIDPSTGCRSGVATIQIPVAPDFDGLLTGCYCIEKKDLPTQLPLYTLGQAYTLPWEWNHDHSAIACGSIPPSPSILPIPFPGDYQLVILDYGLGCRAISPSLVIESEGCKPQVNSGTTPSVWGFVAKKECELIGCKLQYRIIVTVCNGTDDPVCIDDIHPTLPIYYSITSGIPMMLNPGECQDVSLVMQYDFSSPSSFVFAMACGAESVGAFVVDLSDWMDCVQPDTCQINMSYAFSIDTALSMPNQSAFFNFALSFPSIYGTVISVGCDQGQIIDGSCSGTTYSGLLMMDYGLMTQMVADSADFCFHIVCCDNGRICISTVCIPYSLFWDICGSLKVGYKSQGSDESTESLLVDGDKAFVLVPNPASSWVKVMGQNTSNVIDEIKLIEVFSMNGQKVISIESSNQFDVSRLSVGSYIVKVVTTKDHHEYLKLIKQ